MGWNQGYTIFESTVVGAYDHGKLDKKLLAILMEPYRGTDIDSGGSNDLVAKDGLKVEEIVIKTMGKKPPLRPNFAICSDAENDAYYEKLGEEFHKISKKKFGWR